MLKGKNIGVCVAGGIAAYKACELVSKLVQKEANVKVIMTENATKFVNPLTFQALSRNEVFIDTFIENTPKEIAHIALSDWADFFIIAPATANLIAKLTVGLGDDMLTTTLLATTAPVYVSPAMNVHMYEHPTVRHNLNVLSERGYRFIEPSAGYLACGYVGKGRLEEPDRIIEIIENDFYKEQPLKNKHVLISAGPTREAIDPVRFLSNRSSGKMGFALAKAALDLGAKVTLVTGPVNIKLQEARAGSLERVDVTTADEMYVAMHKYFTQSDLVIKAAAVSDYKPKQVHAQKMKKNQDNITIEFEKTRDILYSLGKKKREQFLVGFAAETNEVMKYGQEKLVEKNLDAIVINNVLTEGAGFDGDTNIVTYVNKNFTKVDFPLNKKEFVAKQILLQVVSEMKGELK